MPNFYADVIVKSAKFTSKNPVNDLEMLEPVTRNLVQCIIADAAANGLQMMVFETYRSKERQELLNAQGATKLKKVGVHHYGLACDIVKSINGKPSWKGDFSLLGHLAHHRKLIWGGDWGTPGSAHSFLDNDHVQRCTMGRQADLFNGIWYPDDNYDPYADL